MAMFVDYTALAGTPERITRVDFSLGTFTGFTDFLTYPVEAVYMENSGAKAVAFISSSDVKVFDTTSDPPTQLTSFTQGFNVEGIETYFETDYLVFNEDVTDLI